MVSTFYMGVKNEREMGGVVVERKMDWGVGCGGGINKCQEVPANINNH
jgi:hypothetical protein